MTTSCMTLHWFYAGTTGQGVVLEWSYSLKKVEYIVPNHVVFEDVLAKVTMVLVLRSIRRTLSYNRTLY
eukprot:6204731-Amphidinium_carterae.1